MKHSAKVIAVNDPVSIPESGQSAIAILLECDRGIYLALGSPHPPLGALLTWEGGRAWYGGIEARKIDYAFSADAPLR